MLSAIRCSYMYIQAKTLLQLTPLLFSLNLIVTGRYLAILRSTYRVSCQPNLVAATLLVSCLCVEIYVKPLLETSAMDPGVWRSDRAFGPCYPNGVCKTCHRFKISLGVCLTKSYPNLAGEARKINQKFLLLPPWWVLASTCIFLVTRPY
jgi:hypothetical protein